MKNCKTCLDVVMHHACKAVPHKSPPETQTALKAVMITDLAIG